MLSCAHQEVVTQLEGVIFERLRYFVHVISLVAPDILFERQAVQGGLGLAKVHSLRSKCSPTDPTKPTFEEIVGIEKLRVHSVNKSMEVI